jgi:hypothetical protein
LLTKNYYLLIGDSASGFLNQNRINFFLLFIYFSLIPTILLYWLVTRNTKNIVISFSTYFIYIWISLFIVNIFYSIIFFPQIVLLNDNFSIGLLAVNFIIANLLLIIPVFVKYIKKDPTEIVGL